MTTTEEHEAERRAFEAIPAFKFLDFTIDTNCWGKPFYIHSHVQALFYGWLARAKSSPAPAPSALPEGEVAKVEEVECVSYDNGFAEPAPSLYRIELDGICADFEHPLAAENFAAAINRRIATPPAPAVPEGFSIVPIEPTEEMLSAAYKWMRMDPSCAPFSRRILLKGWDAMLDRARRALTAAKGQDTPDGKEGA